MGKFYLTDGTHLIATGECQDGMEEAQAYGNLTAVAGDPPAGMLAQSAPPPAYDKLRALAYPEVGAQIDALWHAMDDGVLPKIEPMYSQIKAVKEAYPKPSN